MHVEQFRAMGCPCELRLAAHHNHLVSLCLNEIERFEAAYSRYRDDSLVSRINRSAGGEWTAIDTEMEAILDYADVCYRLSDGRFDITSGVLRKIWRKDMSVLPAEKDIAIVLKSIGWEKVQRRPGEVRLPFQGMEIDLGGVVKEYVADALVTLLHKAGVTSGLVNLGGDIAIVGPQPDGAPWPIGIADPDDPSTAMATIDLAEGAITTSGGYERYIEIDGERFSHLLDPTTGWPVNTLLSVTAIASQAVVAGSISSIALLMNETDSKAWLEASEAPYLALDTTRNFSGNLTLPRVLAAH